MTSQDVTPQGLALALTLLEGDKFRLISPSDYLAHLCGRSERTNVDAAMSVNGKIKLWVQQNIVHFDALDPRVSVMTFYINTAKVWLFFSLPVEFALLISVLLGTGTSQFTQLSKPHGHCTGP